MTLNASARAHATSLIAAGKVDETSEWAFDANDENALLGDPPNWGEYGRWFMGTDSAADPQTKAHYHYPFGKDGKVYRSALRAIASRASQQNDTEISNAASDLIKEMDGRNAQNLLSFRPNARRPVGATGAPRQWYRMVAQAAGDAPATHADVYLYDDIGAGFWTDGVTAKDFINELNALPASVATIRLHINSPGGDVFDALAMANALRQHPAAVDVSIEGLCASAATIVSSAGTNVIMADNALMMVHKPLSLAFGNAVDMRAMADVLDRLQGVIVNTYQWISPKSAAELNALMDATTWMDADQAIANGLATEKSTGLQVAATLDAGVLDRVTVPDRYRDRVRGFLKPPVNAAPSADVLAAVAAAGLDVAFAQELVAAALPIDQVTARIETAKTERTERDTRTREIRALCTAAKLPELADGYIAGAMPLEAIRAHLTTITAKLDRVEIDNHPPVDSGRQSVVIDVAGTYAERNKPR
jgi:ATP-dependent protease ClpP protease subunit